MKIKVIKRKLMLLSIIFNYHYLICLNMSKYAEINQILNEPPVLMAKF